MKYKKSFAGSPSEMLEFAHKFENDNYSTCIPRIAGHGTNPADFVKTTSNEWKTSALNAYKEFSTSVQTKNSF